MHPSFEKFAKQPEVVNEVVKWFFPFVPYAKRFSKVFYNLFPDSLVHNYNMQSFLKIFQEFRYIVQSNCSEKQAVYHMYTQFGIPIVEDGVYQFWAYLVQIYGQLVQKNTRENFDNIFAFMNEFPIDETRVVIVGHDSSPKCESSGFAFHGSICSSTELVMDFINEEFKLLDKFCDDGKPVALTEDELVLEKRKCSFMKWIKQGVLMINSKLTFGESLWLDLTDFLVKYISDNVPNTVFILAGGTAAEKRELINKSEKEHLVIGVYHPTHRTHHDERFKWDARLPFINVNFYLYQLSLEQNAKKSMINWVDLPNSDEIEDTVLLKFKSLNRHLLEIAKQAPHLISKYAGEFVHANESRVLMLRKLHSGHFVVKQIDPYQSLEKFTKHIETLLEVESKEVIFQMRNNFGRTLLHEAVQRLDVDVATFKRMVTFSGDINTTDMQGNNILMTAIQKKRFQSLIDLMFSLGARPVTIGDSRQNRLCLNESPVKNKPHNISFDDQSKENATLLEEPACKRRKIE